MMISFIKGKKLSKPTWPCVKKLIAPLLLNHERTDIKHIILESWVNFTSQTQAWLLPVLLNQEIT